jgi:hypothetical protein
MSEPKAHEHYCPLGRHPYVCSGEGCAKLVNLPCDDCIDDEEYDDED